MGTWNEYKKCLAALPLALLMNLYCFRPEQGLDGDFNRFLLGSIFDIRSGDGYRLLVLSFMSMGFLLVFALLCGMDIYQEMYSSGIYAVIRVKNRIRWVASLILKLAGKALLFSCLYMAVTYVLQRHYTQMEPDERTIYAVFLSVFFLTSTTLLIALVINYLSIRKNTVTGCFGGTVVLLLMILYTLSFDSIPVIGEHRLLLYLDPLCMTNLFYEGNVRMTAGFLLYYVLLLVLFTAVFSIQTAMMDLMGVNEDI